MNSRLLLLLLRVVIPVKSVNWQGSKDATTVALHFFNVNRVMCSIYVFHVLPAIFAFAVVVVDVHLGEAVPGHGHGVGIW